MARPFARGRVPCPDVLIEKSLSAFLPSALKLPPEHSWKKRAHSSAIAWPTATIMSAVRQTWDEREISLLNHRGTSKHPPPLSRPAVVLHGSNRMPPLYFRDHESSRASREQFDCVGAPFGSDCGAFCVFVRNYWSLWDFPDVSVSPELRTHPMPRSVHCFLTQT